MVQYNTVNLRSIPPPSPRTFLAKRGFVVHVLEGCRCEAPWSGYQFKSMSPSSPCNIEHRTDITLNSNFTPPVSPISQQSWFWWANSGRWWLAQKRNNMLSVEVDRPSMADLRRRLSFVCKTHTHNQTRAQTHELHLRQGVGASFFWQSLHERVAGCHPSCTSSTRAVGILLYFVFVVFFRGACSYFQSHPVSKRSRYTQLYVSFREDDRTLKLS